MSMVDNATFLHDPSDELSPPKQFSYDYSYWSHDGFELSTDGYFKPSDGSKYADQKQLFKDLGVGLLENAWSGFNCTLFAYGQTGSGKTYSMLGHGPNQGMVPLLCERLFDDIASKIRLTEVTYQFVDIYEKEPCEFHGLLTYPVSSYKEVAHYIEECNKNRTVAVTKMNENSSRAHTIVTISFLQNLLRENRTKMSKINLVDLAGSERASQTGATGVRFEESKNINQSLLTLGIVIKNLCAVACGRTDQRPTPYRDSKLTMLLKDAIGGNCKTIMVATISPSDQDYSQTLSTLRYADRVKSIRNEVIANVTQTDLYIQEFLEEKEALLAKLEQQRCSKIGYTEKEMKRLQDKQLTEIQQIRNQMVNAEKTWQTKLLKTKQLMEEQITNEKKLEKDMADIPHLWNLNEDPALTAKIIHFVRPGEFASIGNCRALKLPTIELHGPSIAREHGTIQNKDTVVAIKPLNGQIRVNGASISQQTSLKHQDRIFFSANNIFVFHDPFVEREIRRSGRQPTSVTFEMAQNEIGEHCGVDSGGLGWLKQEVAETLILTNEANAVAFELKRGIRFEPVIVPGLVLGDNVNSSKVFVRVNTTEGGEFLWGKHHFQDRFDLMMEIFRIYETETDWEPKTKTQDPFWEPLETPTLVGVSFVPLESIAYMLNIEEQVISIYDYQARHVGHLCVSLVPCSEDGEETSDEVAVEEPLQLLNKDIIFKVKIKGAIRLPRRFKTTWCQYMFHTEQDRVYTEEAGGVVPKYDFEHLHHLDKISQKTIEFLEAGNLMIEIHGRQGKTKDGRSGISTDAFTEGNRRPNSTASSQTESNIDSSEHGSQGCCKIRNVLIEEETKTEKDYGQDSSCPSALESNVPFDESVTSSNSRKTGALELPDLLDRPRLSGDGLSAAFEEIRSGVALVMTEVIKREGVFHVKD